jgi:hypothetical protein
MQHRHCEVSVLAGSAKAEWNWECELNACTSIARPQIRSTPSLVDTGHLAPRIYI